MNNFKELTASMQQHGMQLPKQAIEISVENARAELENAMRYFVSLQKRNLQWVEEYDAVADWLQDNKGRGLLMYGQCGRGKSLLGRYVLPALLLRHCKKVTTVLDMQAVNKDIDSALTKHLISLDDVGTEEQSVRYGERRLAFAELMDAAEKESKLLIISTNLSGSQLEQRYGTRTYDRLKSTTRRVLFRGDSFRK